MKFFIFAFLIIFTAFSTAIFSLGLANSGAALANNYLGEKINDVKIRVLGASEEIKDLSLSEGRLPESGERFILPAIEPYNLPVGCGTIADIQENKILFNKDADKEWPLASITKLMTALVFLDYNPGWEEIYEVRREDRREGGKIYLFTGDKVKVKDLFYLSLVGSGNTETIGLVNATGLSEEEFVKKMNEKAESMGLTNTHFYDPAGLNNSNVSTAKETAVFAKIALADKDISEATLAKSYGFVTLAGRKKTIYNTDDLLDIFPRNGIKIAGGKTGYTEAAGYCFVGKFIDHNGREMISVVLGGDSKDSRFMETRGLVEWAYKNYVW
jgi:D-alanyl-D-alanine carboxypeptidase